MSLPYWPYFIPSTATLETVKVGDRRISLAIREVPRRIILGNGNSTGQIGWLTESHLNWICTKIKNLCGGLNEWNHDSPELKTTFVIEEASLKVAMEPDLESLQMEQDQEDSNSDNILHIAILVEGLPLGRFPLTELIGDNCINR
ncbi:uncharacterized protein LOC115628367 [Scaptodrosophila lebanonensis]|uniref:Uncharacterized protein LOC115628367 n=1 Tax=Drosophila lebanonensis TaxID=7225 RepID=A0A6J2TYT4_DROLE|nr:uncharacterized protein LOC115628367 [Scaptodrosophila lebanonensis]